MRLVVDACAVVMRWDGVGGFVLWGPGGARRMLGEDILIEIVRLYYETTTWSCTIEEEDVKRLKHQESEISLGAEP